MWEVKRLIEKLHDLYEQEENTEIKIGILKAIAEGVGHFNMLVDEADEGSEKCHAEEFLLSRNNGR